MVPIESILGVIQFFISVFIAYRLNQSVKRNPKNVNIKYFLYTFVLLSVVFAFSAVSILSIINFRADFLISAINIIGRGFILLGVMFFAYIPLNVLKDKFWKGALPFIILIVAVLSNLFSLMSLFNHPRTPMEEVGPFVLRMHRTDMYTRVGVGVIALVAIFTLGLASYKYFKIVQKKLNDDYVVKRGLLIIGAALSFAFGMIFNYFVAFNFPIFGRVASEILFLIALILFLISVLYRKESDLAVQA